MYRMHRYCMDEKQLRELCMVVFTCSTPNLTLLHSKNRLIIFRLVTSYIEASTQKKSILIQTDTTNDIYRLQIL